MWKMVLQRVGILQEKHVHDVGLEGWRKIKGRGMSSHIQSHQLYHSSYLSHLIRIFDVTVREVRWTPAAHLVSDVDTSRHDDGEQYEQVHCEAAVETVTETVTTTSPGVFDVPERRQ